MAKVVAPLQSFSASGKLGKSIYFQFSKGRNIVRQNQTKFKAFSKTQRQKDQMVKMQNIMLIYKFLPLQIKEEWKEKGKLQNRTGYNLFISQYINNPLDYSVFSNIGVLKLGINVLGIQYIV